MSGRKDGRCGAWQGQTALDEIIAAGKRSSLVLPSVFAVLNMLQGRDLSCVLQKSCNKKFPGISSYETRNTVSAVSKIQIFSATICAKTPGRFSFWNSRVILAFVIVFKGYILVC